MQQPRYSVCTLPHLAKEVTRRGSKSFIIARDTSRYYRLLARAEASGAVHPDVLERLRPDASAVSFTPLYHQGRDSRGHFRDVERTVPRSVIEDCRVKLAVVAATTPGGHAADAAGWVDVANMSDLQTLVAVDWLERHRPPKPDPAPKRPRPGRPARQVSEVSEAAA